MLVNKAGWEDMDPEIAWTAGIIWIDMYDLAGAVGSESIKSVEIIEGFIAAIGKRYELDEKNFGKSSPICPEKFCLLAFICLSVK